MGDDAKIEGTTMKMILATMKMILEVMYDELGCVEALSHGGAKCDRRLLMMKLEVMHLRRN